VAFAARQSLTECQTAAGLGVGEVRLSGGAARSPLWNQVKATAHGLPMAVMEAIDSATLGAALLGLVAAGIETDLWSASARIARVAVTVEPDPAGRARSDDLYEAYRESYQALLPVFTRLAAGPTSSARRSEE
jgi:xylulokinase